MLSKLKAPERPEDQDTGTFLREHVAFSDLCTWSDRSWIMSHGLEIICRWDCEGMISHRVETLQKTRVVLENWRQATMILIFKKMDSDEVNSVLRQLSGSILMNYGWEGLEHWSLRGVWVLEKTNPFLFEKRFLYWDTNQCRWHSRRCLCALCEGNGEGQCLIPQKSWCLTERQLDAHGIDSFSPLGLFYSIF